MTAVNQYEETLMFASENLQRDMEIVMSTVKQNVRALKLVS